jgi:prefoldin subunit 5
VSRSQADEEPEATDSYDQPVIFSQTEIESVGLSAQARVRLLDSFQSADESTTQSAERLAAQIKSLTAEIRSVTREVEVLDAQLLQLPITEQELKALAEEEQAVTKLSTDIATKQQQIRAIATDATSLSVQAAIFQRAQKSVRSWYSELEHLNQSEPELESWPESAGPSDKLDKARKKLCPVGAGSTSSMTVTTR